MRTKSIMLKNIHNIQFHYIKCNNSNRNARTSAALLEVRDDWLVGVASQDIHRCDWLKTLRSSYIANLVRL